MATVAANIATIQAQAAVLDSLVTQFKAAKALIDAAELDIRQQRLAANHDAISGRVRLAMYGHALMISNLNGGKSCATLASEAWAGVS